MTDDRVEFWTRLLSQAKSDQVLDLFLTICWLIWKNRNDCFHEFRCLTPQKIVNDARRLLEALRQTSGQRRTGVQTHDFGWQPPEDNILKINVDAGFNAARMTASLGVVARTAEGYTRFCAKKCISRSFSPLHAELLAIVLGVDLEKMMASEKFKWKRTPL
ncbi:hypothetical protein DITRI_Ditri02bG0135500 [Diplodiscus trichospermus]